MKALKISIFIISLLAINNKLIGESNKIKVYFNRHFVSINYLNLLPYVIHRHI